MSVKALLIGVSKYPANGYSPLPLCEQDILAMKDAIINGLKVDESNIIICGQLGYVTLIDLQNALRKCIRETNTSDTLIFYFTGHGGNNLLALSDSNIELQDLINLIENIDSKNKLIILDSCHSGSFNVSAPAKLEITETVDCFAGKGYAVLASCGAAQTSGFHPQKLLSLYTSFVCEAFTNPYLIQKGKKSLELINQSIYQSAKLWNDKNKSKVQYPIFRASMGGTIYFDVEQFNPYKVKQVYEELDDFIIYSVEPVHHAQAKRLSAKVIMRHKSTKEDISNIANIINNKIINYEIFNNPIAEQRYKGRPANVIWCYFGYDEDDMIDPNFICHTTWIDETQDKNNWYRPDKHSEWVNGIYISFHPSYNMIKQLMHGNKVNKDDFIKSVRKTISNLISLGEHFIYIFREYCNKTITEEQLTDQVRELNIKITSLYFMLNDMDVPPKELHDWFQAHIQISSTIQDLTLFYDKRFEGKWTTENKIYLVNSTIKRYSEELENLKTIDTEI